MKSQDKIPAIARAILKHEGYPEANVVGGYPDEKIDETSSQIVFQVPKIYYFDILDDRIRIGYDGVHFHFTEDGRYARISSFGGLLRDNGSIVKKLPEDVMPQ